MQAYCVFIRIVFDYILIWIYNVNTKEQKVLEMESTFLDNIF